MRKILLLSAVPFILLGCSEKTETPTAQTASPQSAEFASGLQEQLLDAKAGDVITIPEGVFEFERSLSLNIDGVTIRGAGMDKTVLSFKGQVAGAEGLLVTANDFTLENLAIVDSIGDALKVNEGKNITIRGVRTEWTGGPKTANGAYGIYPVQCENVLIEDSVAIAASDAGIYVGQSKNIIVRNNRAEYNVAGIEIENSIGADVYKNIATNNTGGILVFNMPNLAMEGHTTRVYDNQIFDNNTKNFGHEGTPVASVPAGSGIVINSNDKVEIFGNSIKNNRTANIIISSVYSTGYNDLNKADGFDPYPESIYIYDNEFVGGGNKPDGTDLKLLKTVKFGPTGAFPDILWDGFFDAGKLVNGKPKEEDRICVQNDGVELFNADGPHEYKNPSMADMSAHDCALPKLPKAVFSQ